MFYILLVTENSRLLQLLLLRQYINCLAALTPQQLSKTRIAPFTQSLSRLNPQGGDDYIPSSATNIMTHPQIYNIPQKCYTHLANLKGFAPD